MESGSEPTPNGPTGPGDGNASGSAGPVLTVGEIVDYVTCPLMYAFKHAYRVKDTRLPSIHEMWGQVLGEVFVWMYAQLLDSKPVIWSCLLVEWEQRWGDACKKIEADFMELTRARNRGARHIRSMFDTIQPEMGVLGVLYPYSRKISGFTVEGEVPVIRILEQKDKGKSGREIQIISIDPLGTRTPNSFEACRNFGLIIAKYGIEPGLRHHFRKIAKTVVSMVYLPRIPKIFKFKTTERAGRQAVRWIGWVIESIELGHFYPRAGAHCSNCFYQPVCDIRYVSNNALADTSTPDTIRSKLCPTSK